MKTLPRTEHIPEVRCHFCGSPPQASVSGAMGIEVADNTSSPPPLTEDERMKAFLKKSRMLSSSPTPASSPPPQGASGVCEGAVGGPASKSNSPSPPPSMGVASMGDVLLDPPQRLDKFCRRYQSPSRSGSPCAEAPDRLYFNHGRRQGQDPRLKGISHIFCRIIVFKLKAVFYFSDLHWGPEWDSSWMHRSSLARRFRHPPSPPRPPPSYVKPPCLSPASSTAPVTTVSQALPPSKRIQISSASGCPACAKLGCANTAEGKEKALHTCLHPAYSAGNSCTTVPGVSNCGASSSSPFTLTPDEVKEVLSVLRFVLLPVLHFIMINVIFLFIFQET